MSEAKPDYELVLGSDLRVGDFIDVWWMPKRDLITELRAYEGSLRSYLDEACGGARIATFALLKGDMTIENNRHYHVIQRVGEAHA
jgi:hypothetical protein